MDKDSKAQKIWTLVQGYKAKKWVSQPSNFGSSDFAKHMFCPTKQHYLHKMMQKSVLKKAFSGPKLMMNWFI